MFELIDDAKPDPEDRKQRILKGGALFLAALAVLGAALCGPSSWADPVGPTFLHPTAPETGAAGTPVLPAIPQSGTGKNAGPTGGSACG